jgi:hypothetical protein
MKRMKEVSGIDKNVLACYSIRVLYYTFERRRCEIWLSYYEQGYETQLKTQEVTVDKQ